MQIRIIPPATFVGLCHPTATPDGRPGQGVLREGKGAEAGTRRPAPFKPRPREPGRHNFETRNAEKGNAQGHYSVLL